MAQIVNMVNRTEMPSPYIKSKQQAQNTKELFDLLRPDRMGGGGAEKQGQAEKAGRHLAERIKQQFVSNDSAIVTGSLKKFLDAAALMNGKSGTPIFADKDIQRMMLRPENLLRELNSQQQGASIFKGQLFDELRNLLNQSKYSSSEQQGAIKEAVVGLLRQYANLYIKAQRPAEHGEPKANGEQKGTQQSTEAGKEAIRQKASADIPVQSTKAEAETSLKRAEALFYKAIDKLSEALKGEGNRFESLRIRIDELKPEAVRMIMNQIMESKELQQHSSLDKVLDVILSKLEESTGSDTVKLYGEQIVRGLLNSNTVNQPILHFILPLLFENMGAFAEMWVDPDAENPEGEGKNGKAGKAIRVFLTIDLEEKGKAEIDMILSASNKVYTTLYHPPELAPGLKGAKEFIAAVMQDAGFSVGQINVEELHGAHPIDEIMGRPLERRMSVDAKV